MALGSGPTTHRKRQKKASKSVDEFTKRAISFSKKGNCTAAQNALIDAALQAGISVANDLSVRRKRKSRGLMVQADVKKLYAAKKQVATKGCAISRKSK
jgi:hypothetical protein